MNVLFIVRSTLYKVKGGDTVQVLETAKALRDLHISVTVKKTIEKINYNSFDLLHFFNVTRPADILYHIEQSGKPYVITPIYIDYSIYDKHYRSPFMRHLLRLFNNDTLEYIKTIGRCFINGESIQSKKYWWLGQRECIKRVLKHADALIAASNAELHQLQNYYQVYKPAYVIPPGINTKLFHSNNIKKEDNLVLCVGRIEGIKNQLRLIKALKGSPYRLVCIGAAAPNHKKYYKSCLRELDENMLLLDHQPQETIIDYYKKAKVHVLPSLFENFGLSTLEAALMGCQVVVSKNGFIHEYLKPGTPICDPEDISSIRSAIDSAITNSSKGSEEIKSIVHLTWQEAAAQISLVYQKVLKSKK